MKTNEQTVRKNLISEDVQNRHRHIVFPATSKLFEDLRLDNFCQTVKFYEATLKSIENPENFASKGAALAIGADFTAEQYSSQDAYDNLAVSIADKYCDFDLHEIVSELLKTEKARIMGLEEDITSDSFNGILRGNSLAKSFLQIQISRHRDDKLLPKILNNHFVKTLRMDLISEQMTTVGESLGCPKNLIGAFKGLEDVEESSLFMELETEEIRPVILRPLEESKTPAITATPVPTDAEKDETIASKKPSVISKCCGALSSVIKVGSYMLLAGASAMAFECLTKVSVGLTSALSNFLSPQSQEPYARASTALQFASLWLTNPNKQPERMTVSLAVVIVGATALAYETFKYCYSSRNKTQEIAKEGDEAIGFGK
jgi:hypothetical protein